MTGRAGIFGQPQALRAEARALHSISWQSAARFCLPQMEHGRSGQTGQNCLSRMPPRSWPVATVQEDGRRRGIRLHGESESESESE